MTATELSLRHIRIVTKERPHDRFLTAQVRMLSHDKDDGNGALFFVVEINNPWFPNSQIGQTIINTVIREFKRGEHSSPLQNFEIALRKTNEVLSSITQSGETDWIGNLSSVIALSNGPHLYLAQTGKARAYLVRGGRISDLTEGLESETDHHPLTTYTNITSGTLEAEDRVLMASSLLPEALSQSELKNILTQPSLPDAVNELIQALHRQHVKRVHGFAIEAIADAGLVETETVYADQSPNHPLATINKAWRQHVTPTLARGAKSARNSSAQATRWAKDWLIPRVADWTKTSATAAHKSSQKLITETQNRLSKTKLKAKLETQPGRPPEPTSDIRVHHYTDVQRKSRLPIKFSITNLARFSVTTKKLVKKLSITGNSKQRIMFGIALTAILLVIISASFRHGKQQTEQKETSTNDALITARDAQQTAERAFVLGQKESAKTNFLLALTTAQTAASSNNATVADEAKTILTQSQSLFDQLVVANRLGNPTPITTLTDTPIALDSIQNQVIALVGKQIFTGNIGDEITRSTEFTLQPKAGFGDTNINNSWYLPAINSILSYNTLSRQAVDTKLITGNWENAVSLASFGTTLYTLDTISGQIWKHASSDDSFAEGKPYLPVANQAQLSNAIDLAIDGDVFVLKSTGEVIKYTRGVLQADWQLKNLPTPWDKISTSKAIYTNENASMIYLLEDKSTDHPARLIEFTKDGNFVRQLLFSQDWSVTAFAWDSVTMTGLIANGKDIYKVDWTK